jgi:hypothetical protein
LRKAFLAENNFSCQSSQYDIISAIDQYIQDSNITWQWLHVKGRQDDFYGPLDCWSTLNVEMDELAKKRQASDVADNTHIQHDIKNELWQVYTGVPIQRQLILPSKHKVCNSLNEEIKLILEGNKIKKYWTDHRMIPDSAVESIDWPAISKA